MSNEARTVRLGDLEHDPVAIAQPGQLKRIDQLDDLLASIPHQGIGQSLLVRPWQGKAPKGLDSKFGVVAGNRRLATIRRCRDEGLTIAGYAVTDDYPVPVVVRDLDDAGALELRLAENVQRLDMAPGEEALAFADMAKRSSIADVGLHFGWTDKYVRQRLKLAALHPDLLALLDGGDLTIAAAEAYTLEPDPAKQLKTHKILAQWAKSDPRQIRDALTQKIVTAKSTIAKLIGAKAYKAEGGEVLEDEFTGEVYWISPDVVKRALAAHWQKKIVAWHEEGWLFVEEAAEFLKNDHSYYGSGLHNYQKLKAPKGGFTKQQKAVAGVVYFENGDREPVLGVLRKGTRVNNDGSPIKKDKVAAAAVELTNPGPTTAAALNDQMTKALRGAVAADPELGLRIAVATLHARTLYFVYDVPVRVSMDGLERKLQPDAAKANPLGGTFRTALAWAAQQDRETLLAKLAELLAPAVDVRGVHGMPGAAQRAIIDLVAPDGALAAGFDPAAYFAGLTKPLIAAAAREFAPEGEFKDGKKGELVTAAVALVAGTGWLPPQLRTASYAGPGAVPQVVDTVGSRPVPEEAAE